MTSSSSGGSGVGVIASATPYPWPYHGSFDPSRCALVACLDARWRRAGPTSDTADDRLAAIARALRRHGGYVVSVTANPPRVGIRARVEETGAPRDARAAAVIDSADCTLESGGTSAFYSSGLDDVLRAAGRTDLIVAGWGLEGPVHSTLRSANDRGYECLLVADASTPVVDDLVEAACSMVRFSGGIFGAVAPTRDLLALTREHNAASRQAS